MTDKEYLFSHCKKVHSEIVTSSTSVHSTPSNLVEIDAIGDAILKNKKQHRIFLWPSYIPF